MGLDGNKNVKEMIEHTPGAGCTVQVLFIVRIDLEDKNMAAVGD